MHINIYICIYTEIYSLWKCAQGRTQIHDTWPHKAPEQIA